MLKSVLALGLAVFDGFCVSWCSYPSVRSSLRVDVDQLNLPPEDGGSGHSGDNADDVAYDEDDDLASFRSVDSDADDLNVVKLYVPSVNGNKPVVQRYTLDSTADDLRKELCVEHALDASVYSLYEGVAQAPLDHAASLRQLALTRASALVLRRVDEPPPSMLRDADDGTVVSASSASMREMDCAQRRVEAKQTDPVLLLQTRRCAAVVDAPTTRNELQRLTMTLSPMECNSRTSRRTVNPKRRLLACRAAGCGRDVRDASFSSTWRRVKRRGKIPRWRRQRAGCVPSHCRTRSIFITRKRSTRNGTLWTMKTDFFS